SIERRKFVLQQVNFLKKLQLYLRITDPTESRTLSITPLGTTVSFDRPQWAVDADTHFHVLHRASGKTYLYHVFQGDGTLLTRQFWEGENRPQLEILNESGEIGVKGGQRRASSSDFPPPPETTNSVSLKEPAPSGTASSTSESNKNDTPPPPQ
ncbi:MAG: hypothetical protein JNL10_04200, partial [Verrucomicrobiales bacterium]|nr:hypothetical protein [Verrucomicrobiales bacterium]